MCLVAARIRCQGGVFMTAALSCRTAQPFSYSTTRCSWTATWRSLRLCLVGQCAINEWPKLSALVRRAYPRQSRLHSTVDITNCHSQFPPSHSSDMAARLSGLQREVLSLYRQCLRAVREKPSVRCYGSAHLVDVTNNDLQDTRSHFLNFAR